MNKERELDRWCNLIYNYIEEWVENKSEATKWIFNRATHDEWVLDAFPKHLASKQAYNEFFNLTGKDIRDFDWNSKVVTKDGKKITVHTLFKDEHLTTAHDFKYELVYLYQTGDLTIDKIKKLIYQQRLCWITKDEDKRLTFGGYSKHRPDPLKAYEECGIEIYDKENEDLNIMKPTFPLDITKKAKVNAWQNNPKSPMADIIPIVQKFFQQNAINGNFYKITRRNANDGFACIYNQKGFWINFRAPLGKWLLKDINLYIVKDKNKHLFNQLFRQRDEIETKLGYKLFWDENTGGNASRIGVYFKNAPLKTNFEKENSNKCLDFNTNDPCWLQKMCEELVRFNNAFVPLLSQIFNI